MSETILTLDINYNKVDTILKQDPANVTVEQVATLQSIVKKIRKPKPEFKFNKDAVEKIIDEIPQDKVDTYNNYWKDLVPKTNEEYFLRWVFAIFSVHCGWKANVKGYNSYVKEKEITSTDALRNIIKFSGVGLISLRTKGIWQFKEDFFKDPSVWKKKTDETWEQFRFRTMSKVHGLGYAKTAFAIELCYPNECEIACLDTHMLRLYGVPKSTPSPSKYRMLEKHWVEKCKSRNIPPFMARNVYWDKVQNKNDSKYWSYVFEPEPVSVSAPATIQVPVQTIQSTEPIPS